MPISWRGTFAQYASRLHRLHDGKREVIIYDYVDRRVPMLAALLARRPAKVAAIALANKMARMVWAMMARGERYKEPVALAA